MQTTTSARFSINDLPRVAKRPSVSLRNELLSGARRWPWIQKRQVIEDLQRRCRFPERRTQQGVLRAYDKAARALEATKRATELFIGELITRSFDLEECYVTQDALPQVELAMFNLLADVVSARFSRAPSIKSLKLLTRSPADIHRALQRDLQQDIRRFVDELYALHSRMLERRLLGRICYAGRNCEFSYFRSKALTFTTAGSTSERVLMTSDSLIPHYRDNQWWRWRESTIEVLHACKAQVRHVSCTHLLSNARTVPLASWRLPLPERIRKVSAAIPDFLRPHAFVVEGIFEFGRIVERDVAELPYCYTTTRTRTEQVRHYDPALLIGGTVVAGWCPQEQPKGTLFQRLAANAWHPLVARKEGGQ